MTVAEMLIDGRQRFSAISDSPRLDAELLIAEVLQWPRSRLLAHDDKTIPAELRGKAEALFQRREAGEPIAYLLGRRGFWTIELDVGPSVLIPRPETELLLELALTVCAQNSKVLDLGTGSGALAICLAREKPGARITATDQSPDALAAAKANAGKLSLKEDLRFLSGDWFGALPEVEQGSFDLIVSNPPYIPENDGHLEALRFEPKKALVSGPDGLRDLQQIIDLAPAWLRSGGWLMLEHGFDQGAAVRERLAQAGFKEISTVSDLSNHERVSRGRLS